MQRSRTSLARILVALLAAGGGTGMAQEIYRWVDENGVVHYGDFVPEGVQAAPVTVRPNTVPAVAPQVPQQPAGSPGEVEGAGGEPELSYAEQRRQERAERSAKRAEEAAQLQADCDRMRQQEQLFGTRTRVILTQENGEARRMDDAERVALSKIARDFLAANCN